MSYAVVGLSQGVSIKELVGLGRTHELAVIHDIGWGGLIQPVGLGLAEQPTAAESLASGVDVVLARGDQLLGGPPCGLLLGRRASVQRMAEHSAVRAFQADRFTLAALEATLRLWRKPEKARRAIPLLDLLGTSVENLANRAKRLAPQLAATAVVASADVVEATASLTGRPLPGQELPTRQIALEPDGMRVDQLASALRLGSPSVVGISREDRLLLDLRSVIPRQDQSLVEALGALARVEE
jgi:L-seryl-tRNA(Ser) seleniumtransferase